MDWKMEPRREPAERIADGVPPKASADDLMGRWREILSDPLNLAIERCPLAGVVDGEGMVVLHNGLRVPVEGPDAYYGAFSLVLTINRGVHEPLEEFAFQEVLREMPEAPVMLELGAYWGHYSMWLKSRRPAATVFLLEPNARNRAIGMRNFDRNGLDAEMMAGAVATGEFSVDAFMQSRGIDRLDVLHADIQGAERDLLAGAADALGRHAIDWIFLSTHSDPLHNACRAILADGRYNVLLSSDFGTESTAHDGFILAAAPPQSCRLGSLKPLGRRSIASVNPAVLQEALARALRCRDDPGAVDPCLDAPSPQGNYV